MVTYIKRNFSTFISLVIAITGLLFSGFVGWNLYENETRVIIKEFEKEVDERASSLDRENQINLEVLRSLTTLFENTTIPSSAKFHRVAQDIINRHKDIQALEWIPRVIHTERSAFVSNRRQEFPDFEITERLKQKHMISAKNRKN